MGQKQAKPVTQTNTVKLGPQQQQIADIAFPFAQQYASSDISLPAPNIIGFNANEIEGQNAALAAARGGMTDQVQNAAATNNFLMNTAMQGPESNPWLSRAADVITQKGNQNLLESVLPSLRSGSVVTGGFYGGGNTRQGIAQGQAVGRTAQASQDAITNLYNDAWKTGLATSGAAVDRSGTVASNLLKPGSTIAGVGAQQRDMDQAQADAASQYAWLQQQLPFIRAQQLYGLLGSMPGGSGVSTVTGSQPQSGGIGGALGGALSGASMGAGLGPMGMIGGGLIGGLGGYLS